MRSKLDQYSINEEASRGLISSFCLENNWKYRKMEWDNDIDGEIEIFAKQGETTAKFIKVQLKTIDNPERFNDDESYFYYDTPSKFLNFCDVCDIPIILAIFNIKEGTGYFLFVQKYIYEVLDQNNTNWRNNLSTVRIKIPLEYSFSSDKSHKTLTEIATDGTKVITQLRKIDTAQKYYNVVEQSDNSHGSALRTSIRVLVEASFSTSKEAMRVLIPKIHDKFYHNVYHRNSVLAELHKGKSYDVIFMGFYNDLEHVNHGLPICTTLWINDELDVNARPHVHNPSETVEDINIYWDSARGIPTFIRDNILNKGQYLPIIDDRFSTFEILHNKVLLISHKYRNGELSAEKYIKKLKRWSDNIEKLQSSMGNLGFPPHDCNDLDVKINSLIISLHNIKLVINDETRDMNNLLGCIGMYLSSIEEEIPEYKYERKKAT